MSELTTAQPPAQPGAEMLSLLQRILTDPNFDIAKAEAVMRLVDEQEKRMDARRARDAERAFMRDMVAVQQAVQGLAASGKNPTFNRPYAMLADIDAELRPIITAHGFSQRFTTAAAPAPGYQRVGLVISHDEGHEETHYLDGPIDTGQGGMRSRTPIQAIGSTLTYLRRYLLMLVWNLVPASDPTDDDGEGQRGPQGGGYSRRATGRPPGFGSEPPAVQDPSTWAQKTNGGDRFGHGPRFEKRLAEWETACAAAETPDAADRELNSAFAQICGEQLETANPQAWQKFVAARDAMLNRTGSPAPE